MGYTVTYSYYLPFSILLVSSGRHSPEFGRLGEQSSGLTTALFRSPQSPVVLQWSRREANLSRRT